MEVIKDLISLKKMKITGDIAAFVRFLGEVENERDRIAHGVWARDPDTKQICLRVIKGKWNIAGDDGKGVKRLIKPEAMQYDKKKLKAIRLRVEHAIKQIEQIDRMIEKAFRTLPQKSKQPHQP
jgi:hypothetical protein